MDSVVIHGSLGQRSFLFSCQGRTNSITSILRAIYTIHKPIGHNSGVSLLLIISGHGFCGYAWLCRSHGGPFSLVAREELTLVLEFWELYIMYPSQKGIILVCHYL